MTSGPQIPLYLITGFLGSGKTTLLRRIAARRQNRDLVFIVNELSRVDIDAHLVDDGAVTVVSIPGGSIFCRCLVTSFVSSLREIAARRDRAESAVDGVVIEASGIANPGVVGEMLRETGLDELFTLARVITMVDPASFSKLVETLPNIVAQVRAADVLLVNKADLFSEEPLRALERQLRAINPTAIQERTVRCETSLELLTGAHGSNPTGEYACCADPNFATIEQRLAGDVPAELLRATVAELGDDLYRLKGYVRCVGGVALVDASASGFSLTQTDGAEATGLVLIVRGDAEQRVRAVMGELAGRMR